jgi:TetR/AcrR family fatty acid metabolism transcriptional regulator
MPRADVSGERRAQILEAASRVFAKSGVQEARMDDIVQEAGLSKGALYWYFKSKDEIVTAILSRLFQQEFDSWRAILDAEGSARERLILLVRHQVSELQRIPLFLPLAYEFYARSFRSKTVRVVLKDYLRQVFDILIPLIQQGIDRGEFRATDPEEAVIAIGSLLEGTLLLWVYDPDTVDFRRHMETGMRLLLEGLQADAVPPLEPDRPMTPTDR